ncbi:MAG TPA: hypothetical protein VF461_22330 [Gemmatimonadaceae bacterium]
MRFPSPFAAIAFAALIAPAATLRAQEPAVSTPPANPATVDSTRADSGRLQGRPRNYWKKFAAGFASSILAHEGAHIVTAYAVGGHPTIGINKGRPTVYSGISARFQPHQQFLFSSMGLNVQAALNEGILDVPHNRGAPFERGVLAGGIATALFYVTIGRTASVSDIDMMSRTSSLSKTDLTIIYGGVAALHALRVHRDERYADFFVRPDVSAGKGLKIGVTIQ